MAFLAPLAPGAMRLPLTELIRRRLAQTVIALYAVQIATYLVPLVTVPYIARVLGPGEWGRLAVAQSVGSYVMVVVEFGFGLSATREVARHRSAPARVAEVLSSVMAAKVALTVAAAGFVAAAFRFIPVLHDSFLLVAMALIWAVTRGFSPMWLFQGLERVRFAAAVDVAGSALGAAAIFHFVHKPSDGWKVLLCQGIGSALSLIVLLLLAWREFPFTWPRWRSIWDGLVMGGSMFVFRSAVSLYTVANALVLSLFAPPQVVGYYAGAERISRAFVVMMQPVSQAIFPRVSHLVHHAREDAAGLIRLSAVVMGAGGLLAGALCGAFAPLLVRILLGAQFAPAIVLLRILALLPPLVAMSNVLGIQWMIPLGLDRAFNKIILGAGGLNLAMALLLAPRLKGAGMAIAVVVAEMLVTVAALAVLRLRGLAPMQEKTAMPHIAEENARAV